MRSPQRHSTTTTMTEEKTSAESLFLNKNDETQQKGLVWRLIGGLLAMVFAVFSALFSKVKMPFTM